MPNDPLIYTMVRRVGEKKTHTYNDTRIYIHIHMYVSTSLSSPFNSDILTHIRTFNLTENVRVSHTHTHMNTFCIIIAIVELIENIKLFFFKVLIFCQISRVYVTCANLCFTIVELTPQILLFVESRELLLHHKLHWFEMYSFVLIHTFDLTVWRSKTSR